MTNPAAPWSGFQVGNVVEPLSETSATTALFDADPTLYYALDFASYIIRSTVGDRFVAAAQTAGLKDSSGSLVADSVMQRWPVLPDATKLRETQYKFPLLCIGRTTVDTERLTVGHDLDTSKFNLLYVLPPLNPAQYELLYPFLHAIMIALRRKFSQGWDPGYTPTLPDGSAAGPAGALVVGAGYAGAEKWGFGDPYRKAEMAEFGVLEATDVLLFPCLRMFGYFAERDTYNATAQGAQTLTGVDVDGQLVAGDGTVIDDLVQVSVTAPPPTITSLSVTSGPAAGGTTVVITGTGFLPGSTVYFGTYQFSPSVTVSSATSITATTPAMQGASAVPVQVGVVLPVPDGRSAVLSAAFTFS